LYVVGFLQTTGGKVSRWNWIERSRRQKVGQLWSCRRPGKYVVIVHKPDMEGSQWMWLEVQN